MCMQQTLLLRLLHYPFWPRDRVKTCVLPKLFELWSKLDWIFFVFSYFWEFAFELEHTFNFISMKMNLTASTAWTGHQLACELIPRVTLFSDKSVSFEKSVSFSDEIQGVKPHHSPQHMGKSMSHTITPVWCALSYDFPHIKLYDFCYYFLTTNWRDSASFEKVLDFWYYYFVTLQLKTI